MFNKRRGGEASELLVRAFQERPDRTTGNSHEIMQSLNGFERELSKRLDMVEIEGKRGRKVPVLLTKEMKESIDLLTQTRKDVGIPDANPYVFARVNRESLGHIRGWDSLRHFTQICAPPLTNPDAVTGTRLRKYIATISQVLALKENEVDWLARHLGHDTRVHREFYRLHESTIEIAKVSKLLIAVDKGQTTKWAGKTLDEIAIDATKKQCPKPRDVYSFTDSSDCEQKRNEVKKTAGKGINHSPSRAQSSNKHPDVKTGISVESCQKKYNNVRIYNKKHA